MIQCASAAQQNATTVSNSGTSMMHTYVFARKNTVTSSLHLPKHREASFKVAES